MATQPSSTSSTDWWTSILAGPDGTLNAAGGSERYVALPSLSDPRVVVDAAERLAIRHAVERMVSSRTQVGIARAAAGPLAAVAARRGAWTVQAGDSSDTLRVHLSEILGTNVRLAIAVGPPRPNRKPVVRCYGPEGMCAVAKLGPEPHTASMVTNEAHWLDVLGREPLSGVVTPRLLHSGEYGGHPLLVMEALDLESDLGLEFGDVPLDVLSELAERYGGDVPVRHSTWWAELRQRMQDPLLDDVREDLTSLESSSALDAITTAAWHGDWSPWNMGYSRSGELCIWDWERTGVGVPRGFDLLHLHHQYGAGYRDAATGLSALGVPQDLHDVVARLYFYELCARHSEGDALSSDRHTHVLESLERLSS